MTHTKTTQLWCDWGMFLVKASFSSDSGSCRIPLEQVLINAESSVSCSSRVSLQSFGNWELSCYRGISSPTPDILLICFVLPSQMHFGQGQEEGRESQYRDRIFRFLKRRKQTALQSCPIKLSRKEHLCRRNSALTEFRYDVTCV